MRICQNLRAKQTVGTWNAFSLSLWCLPVSCGPRAPLLRLVNRILCEEGPLPATLCSLIIRPPNSSQTAKFLYPTAEISFQGIQLVPLAQGSAQVSSVLVRVPGHLEPRAEPPGPGVVGTVGDSRRRTQVLGVSETPFTGTLITFIDYMQRLWMKLPERGW